MDEEACKLIGLIKENPLTWYPHTRATESGVHALQSRRRSQFSSLEEVLTCGIRSSGRQTKSPTRGHLADSCRNACS